MRAIVFDLDGTLIDSLPDIAASVNHVLEHRGLEKLGWREVRGMIGDGAKILLERAFSARDAMAEAADLAAFNAWYAVHAADETIAYPGVMEVLAGFQAAGHKMAVCTNKPGAAANSVLRALGLERFFETVAGGDATLYRKPDPRHLAVCLDVLGTNHAVMVGDHHNDMEAARGCGIPAIFAAWGYGQGTGACVAHSAAELPGLVAVLQG